MAVSKIRRILQCFLYVLQVTSSVPSKDGPTKYILGPGGRPIPANAATPPGARIVTSVGQGGRTLTVARLSSPPVGQQAKVTSPLAKRGVSPKKAISLSLSKSRPGSPVVCAPHAKNTASSPGKMLAKPSVTTPLPLQNPGCATASSQVFMVENWSSRTTPIP